MPKTAIPVTVTDFTIEQVPRNQHWEAPEQNIDEPNTFEDYIDQLEDWERNLLRTTGNVRDTKDITTRIITSDKTYMVSDGGMANGYGSYGWIIANEDEITKGSGEAEGAKELMQSFRAEGYGMLAALRYILHAFKYTDNWPEKATTIHMYCDNLPLIQRIGWHEKRIVTTPKDVFRSDYDLEVAIKETIDTLRERKIHIKEKHVRGHQDKHAEYDNLSRAEQLNVHADTEATTALQEHSKIEDYNQMPTIISMLYHQNLPITSKETETLRQLYGQIKYSEHVTNRENWKPATYATVWWEAHRRSLTKLEDNDRTRITKFVNRILPTNTKLHQQDTQHSTKCPSCNEPETNDHVSACEHPDRAKLRKNMIRTVRKTMDKTNTSIQTQEVILQGLTDAILHGADKLDLTKISFTPTGSLNYALQDQNAIGWTNFYKGRLSKKWEQVQKDHYRKTKAAKADPYKWATSVITTMWQGFLQMWESRNDDQHGRDNIDAISKEREKLLKKTRQLYEQKESIDPEDRRLYHKPVATWENETNKKIRDWINLAEPLTKTSKKTTRKKKVDPRQPLIKNFFTAQRNEAVPKTTRTYTRRPPRPNQDEE
jgi:hypothetical protein